MISKYLHVECRIKNHKNYYELNMNLKLRMMFVFFKYIFIIWSFTYYLIRFAGIIKFIRFKKKKKKKLRELKKLI